MLSLSRSVQSTRRMTTLATRSAYSPPNYGPVIKKTPAEWKVIRFRNRIAFCAIFGAGSISYGLTYRMMTKDNWTEAENAVLQEEASSEFQELEAELRKERDLQ
eukprot:194094_1